FGKNLLNAAVWMMLTPLVFKLSERLSAVRRVKRVVVHACSAAAFTAIHLAATGLLMRVFLDADAESIRAVRLGWAVWDVIAYATLVAIGQSIAARRRLREQRAEGMQATVRLSKARVALLRLHLQPDLLLGGIDAIEKAIGDPVRCETVITRLGDVLRLLLGAADNEEVTLRDELSLVDAYTGMLGARLLTSVDTRDLEALVPSVVLCALAAASRSEVLQLSVVRRATRLVIELAMTAGTNLGDHVLANTERRLAAIYDSACIMRLIRDDRHHVVILEVPYRVAPVSTHSIHPLGARAIA
ncbi:MAG TPA: histidine kinase, partial [Polyangiales bacterium]|nr:histidine kinase [Polyangiales bacterium]